MSGNQDPQDYLEKARAFREQGDELVRLNKHQTHQEALEKYQKAIELDPNSALAFYKWGNALYDLQRFEEAIEKYQKAVELDRNYALAYLNWGACLANLKHYEEAIEKYQRATELNSNEALVYYKWGLALADLQRYEEAIEKYQEAIELNPKNTVAFLDWGNALEKQGKHEEAQEKYQKANELRSEQCRMATESNPNDSIAFRELGLALINLKQFEEAGEKFNKATDLDPGDALAYRFCGFTLMACKNYDQAIDKFQKATELDPTDAIAYHNWGMTLFNLKRYEEAANKFNEAIEQFNKGIKLDPSFKALIFQHLGMALVHFEQYEEALYNFEMAIELDKGFPAPWHNIALLQMRQGRYRESWEAWEETRKVFARALEDSIEITRDPNFYRYYGETLCEIYGEFPEAEEIFLQGLKLDSQHIGILAGLINLYLSWRDEYSGKDEDLNKIAHYYWKARHKFHQAKLLLKKNLKQSEEISDLLSLGELLIKMEEYEEAENYLKKVLKADAEDCDLIRAYDNLGVLYIRKGLIKKAVKSFQESLRLEPENLTTRNNLAEALHKVGQWELAQKEYKKILRVTEGHVEASLGLGELYTSMGDAGDPEMYDLAIKYFTQGLRLSHTREGSKNLKPKEQAAAHYSRGYARIKLYESTKLLPEETLLTKALDDFKQCADLDPAHDKAKRAKEKVEQASRRFTPQKTMEKYGPLVVVLLSLFIFGLGQYNFFTQSTGDFSAASYAILTFGSLLFLVAGLSLPQILKLKVGGLELEKSSMSPVTTPTRLGIYK